MTRPATRPLFEPGHETIIRAFMRLFTGSSRAYGQFVHQPAEIGEKVEGRARTVSGRAGIAQYAAHLYGEGPGLGIVPIRDDGTCVFAAIDYDERSADHAALARTVEELRLPLVVCRSKSGGAHFYLFTSPRPASEIRATLRAYLGMLGLPSETEVFPKQDQLREGEVGNWINLPYYGELCRS